MWLYEVCPGSSRQKNFRLAYSGLDDFFVLYNSYQNAKFLERSNIWGWGCNISGVFYTVGSEEEWEIRAREFHQLWTLPLSTGHISQNSLRSSQRYHVTRKKNTTKPSLSWVKGEIFQGMLSYPWPPRFHMTTFIQQEKDLSFTLSCCAYWSKTYTVGWQDSVEKCSWHSGGEGFSLGELAYHSSQRPWKLAVA